MMMKLYGRIDADQALLRYRYLLGKWKHAVPAHMWAQNTSIVEQECGKKQWRRRLADATR